MSENTKYDTNIALQSDLEKNLFVTPALYANEVAITAQSETVQTTSDDEVIVIDQSNKATSNIDAPDGNTNIKVGSGYNVININNGNSTITAAGNAYNIITIGNANTNIAVGGGQNKITAGDGNNNITTTGNGTNTITLGDGINNVTTTGNGNSTITAGIGENTIITTGEGNSTINLIGGYNTINGGNGNHTITTNGELQYTTIDDFGFYKNSNYINLGGGNNTLNLEGSRNIVDIGISGQGSNKITTSKDGEALINIRGGSNEIYLRQNNSIQTVRADDAVASDHDIQYITIDGDTLVCYSLYTSYITNLGMDNTVVVGSNSIVIGANYGSFTFLGNNPNAGKADANPDLNSHDLFINPNNAVIQSGTDLTIQGGSSNYISSSGNITMTDATGDTSIMTKGSFTVSGADGLNLNLYSYDFDNNDSHENIFMAGSGNETLNASGNNGDDTLTAGTGNSTFTGGAGANLFAFTKADAAGGNTVITDFAASEDNQIALFNYGLTRKSLSTLLQNSQNDAQGNAVLHLENHNITLQGVSVSDLSTNQFVVYNSK